MPVSIKFGDLPKSVQRQYTRDQQFREITGVSVSVDQQGAERYTVTLKGGHKDRWSFINHEWQCCNQR